MVQRLWVWIPAPYTGWTRHFFTFLFVVKFVMCVWRDDNKRKRGRGWPILKPYTKRVHLKEQKFLLFQRTWILGGNIYFCYSCSYKNAFAFIVPPKPSNFPFWKNLPFAREYSLTVEISKYHRTVGLLFSVTRLGDLLHFWATFQSLWQKLLGPQCPHL